MVVVTQTAEQVVVDGMMTVVMMAWLFVQLFRECGHENRTRVVELKEKIMVLKRRISGSVRRETGGANETDDGERNGTEGIPKHGIRHDIAPITDSHTGGHL